MDYNDISARLKRTLASLNGRFEDDVKDKIFTVFQDTESDTPGMELFIGNWTKEEMENQVNIILYNLASLKDNLKNCLKTKGEDPQIVENEINNSLYLQVLIDLVNQEKHGYPLTRRNRSGKNPIINKLAGAAYFKASDKPGGEVAFEWDLNSGGIKANENTKIGISSNICDKHGAPLFALDVMIDECFEACENIAKTYNCI